MCGIAGLWRFSGANPEDPVRVERMVTALRHRGPDDFGYLFADTVAGRALLAKSLTSPLRSDVLLGCRRLAITDLGPNGSQPMGNEDGTVFVVLNGAIHNFVELRGELETLGHSFRSHSDTEVIVHAYEQWGEDCARRFNGMWAYVIWDGRRRRLVCSRDRFGIKPLMIARVGDAFYFASEAKAILAAGELRAAPNLEVLSRFLGTTCPYDMNDTVFRGIDLLPAAHNLIVTAKGVERSRYWSYRERASALSEQQAEEAFRSVFADAVRLRLRADVPVGLLLSGGLDSSSVAIHAARHTAAPLLAFTATFPGFDRDESRYASIVAAAAGISHYPVAYNPATLIEDADSLIWHLETPLTDPQVFPRWRMLAAASRHATVVLEGQGADELLAGYDSRYLATYRRDERAAITARDFIPRLYRLTMTGHWLRKGRRAIRSLTRVRRQSSVFPSAGILARTLTAADAPTDADLHFPDRLTTALAYDHSRAVLPNLLNYGDRIAMAHAVESRLPFLDHRLVELVFSLPFDAKMRGGVTKYILRKSVGVDLPPQILARRRKIGFATPYADWVDRHYASTIRPVLVSPAALDRPIFDADAVRRLVDHHDKTRTGAAAIFRAYSTTRWYQRFVDCGHS